MRSDVALSLGNLPSPRRVRLVIDADALEAIDVHVHVQASLEGRGFPEGSPEAAVAEVFGSELMLNVPELAAYYRERRMAAVCFMVDTVRWGGPVSKANTSEGFEFAGMTVRLAMPPMLSATRPNFASHQRR